MPAAVTAIGAALGADFFFQPTQPLYRQSVGFAFLDAAAVNVELSANLDQTWLAAIHFQFTLFAPMGLGNRIQRTKIVPQKCRDSSFPQVQEITESEENGQKAQINQISIAAKLAWSQ